MTEQWTQVPMPELSPEEQDQIASGGRVFIVEEIPGPEWRVLMVKGDRCVIMLKPNGFDGYDSQEHAYELARAWVNLSEDSPLLRPI
jgi:hypothetical protein